MIANFLSTLQNSRPTASKLFFFAGLMESFTKYVSSWGRGGGLGADDTNVLSMGLTYRRVRDLKVA